MLPAFRSRFSVLGYCGLLAVLFCLPLVTSWIGHPSREQAYAGLSNAAGRIGQQTSAIFGKSPDADVLFLGSSMLKAGVDLPLIEQALSAHLGRPAHVEVLGMNWQGMDLQYFLLRDYLNTHQAGLIIWNPPVPGSRNLEPHIMAYRWVRFGEYSDALSGLSLRYRVALYGDMVLGAPRELLSHIRPNLLGAKELKPEPRYLMSGYYGADFVPEPVDSTAPFPLEQSYEDPPYNFVYSKKKPLNSYQAHFAKKILQLAEEKHAGFALLHIPIDSEQGLNYMPELDNWASALHTDAPMIGVTSATLFKNVDRVRFYHYYKDQHFNVNGKMLFTRSIIPAILKAYDERDKHE